MAIARSNIPYTLVERSDHWICRWLCILAIAVAITLPNRALLFSFSNAAPTALIRSMLGSVMLLFVAALAEEAMFRGYGLQTLTRAKLAWLAVLLTSVPFGLVHLGNPNVVPGVTFVNTVARRRLVRQLLTCAREVSGCHWDFIGHGTGRSVGSSDCRSAAFNSFPIRYCRRIDTGPYWLTGGSYGIEGGVACTDRA